jgi:hypothetical protein
MAKDLAKINLKLTAENEVLIKKLEQSQKKIGKFTKKSGGKLKKLGSLFKSLGKGISIGSGAAGIALAALTVKTMQATDALGKTSDKLGVMPSKLQAMQRAAQLTGVSVDTANMALQRMVRRVQEASLGTGEAKGAIAQLGLEAKELAQLPVDEQFKRIADAMGDVSESGEKVRLAMKLFDSEGVALVNTLALGSAGLEKIEADMDAFGLSLTRIEISRVEQANDAFLLARENVKSFAQSFVVQLAPAVKLVSDKFSDYAKEQGGFGKISEMLFTKLLAFAKFVIVKFLEMRIAFKNFTVGAINGSVSILKSFMSITNSVQAFIDKITDAPGKLEELENKLVSIERKKGIFNALGFGEGSDSIYYLNLQLKETKEEIAAIGESGEATTSGMQSLIANLQEMGLQANKELTEAMLTPVTDESIQAMIDQVRAKMDQIALAAAEASVAKTDPVLPAEGKEGGEEEGAKELTLMETLFQNKFSIKEFWKNSELEQQAMHEQQMLDMSTRHQDELSKVTDAGEKARLKKKQLAEKTALKTKQQTESQEKKSTAAFFKQGLGALAKNSRAAFSIQKAMDISAAVTNTYAAAMGAYRSLAPIPIVGSVLGAAAAAAAIGFGVKQVQAIKARKFSTGGSVASTGAPSTSAPSASASAPAEPELVAPDLDFEETATPFRQEVTVTASDPFTPSVIRDFIEKLREEDIAVNYDVNFVGG